MYVALDARYLDTKKGSTYSNGGIALYTKKLIDNLLIVSPTIELLLIVPPGRVSPLSEDKRVREVVFDAPAQSFRSFLFLSRLIRKFNVDLFHSPSNVLPLGMKCKTVTTIHDLMWIDMPELCSDSVLTRLTTGSYYKLAILNALKNSDQILTVSNTAKNSIQSHLATAEGKVTTTYNAVDPFYKTLDAEQSSMQSGDFMSEGESFVLMVGQGSPYKNHIRGIRAFLKAFADKKDWKLVLIRRFIRTSSEMAKLLDLPEVKDRVILLQNVDQERLRALYNQASVLLFPSLYEGFGLPIIEAMACGCPVITSNIGAPREISGNAAVLVDPNSIESIAKGLTDIAHSNGLREKKIRQGFERIQDFSWLVTAEKTLDVYEKVCSQA